MMMMMMMMMMMLLMLMMMMMMMLLLMMMILVPLILLRLLDTAVLDGVSSGHLQRRRRVIVHRVQCGHVLTDATGSLLLAVSQRTGRLPVPRRYGAVGAASSTRGPVLRHWGCCVDDAVAQQRHRRRPLRRSMGGRDVQRCRRSDVSTRTRVRACVRVRAFVCVCLSAWVGVAVAVVVWTL